VGEVEALPGPVAPPGYESITVSGRRFRPPEPSWDCPVPRSITHPVAAIRFTAPATPFRRPRGFPGHAIRRVSAGSSRRLGVPFRAYHDAPAEALRGSGDPHGVFIPYSDIHAEVHQPGVPNPVRSASRVSHPPDGLLPPTLPDLKDRYRSWGSSLQSVSPPQSRAPCGFLALLPFLTSRAPALRTRRSRCPAAPGLCSLRRSVPDSSQVRARADTLMGFHARRKRALASRRTGGPDPAPATMGTKPEGFAPGSRGQGDAGSAGFHGSDPYRRAFHQDLSPGSPDDSSILPDDSDRK
jgi:hypothetical protein